MGTRLPQVRDADADAEQAEVLAEILAARGLEQAPPLFAALLNSPEGARTVGALGAHCRGAESLAEDVREVAILAVVLRRDAGFEIPVHEDLARRAGVGEDQLVALRAGDWEALGPELGVAAELAHAVAGPGATEDLVSRARERFGDRGATDLGLLAAYYVMVAALATVLLDDEGRHGVVRGRTRRRG